MLKYFFVELEKLKPLLLSGRSRVMTGNRAHMTTSLLHLLLNLVRTTSTFRFFILQFVYVLSCPGQLNRWPCHSLTQWHTFWFQLLQHCRASVDNDYYNYNDYNDYNDQTWNLSKILHSQIFRLKVLHYFTLFDCRSKCLPMPTPMQCTLG